jgi:hypothetical protein
METAETGFLFAFDIERTDDTKSGFKPAERHFGSGPAPTYLGDKLYADLRINGALAALRLGVVKRLVIPGKDEKRYAGEIIRVDGRDMPLYQGYIIRKMLIEDHDVPADMVDWVPSSGDTGNAAAAMNGHIQGRLLEFLDMRIIFITNLYHCERAREMLVAEGVERMFFPTMFSAESLILMQAEKESREKLASAKELLFKEMNEPDYVKRVVADLGGVAQMRTGTYDRSFGKQGWR